MQAIQRSLLVAMLIVLLTAGCGNSAGSGENIVEVTRVVLETIELEGESVTVAEGRVMATAALSTDVAVFGQAGEETGDNQASAEVAAIPPSDRLIIKHAEMMVSVENTDVSVERAIRSAVNVGGYVVSQRVWSENEYRYAMLTLGVPVEQFERVMEQLRTLGIVTSENASGQDVSEEYVDLESRLETLRTTHTRLLGFLEEAENVEDILPLNEQISQVESELSRIQGRMQYLANRSAFSTIDVHLNPILPTPTPTPSPTPTMMPTAQGWDPGNTAKLASVELQETAQIVGDFLIYRGIVCGPWLLILGVLGYAFWRLFYRRQDERQFEPPSE